jgi:hypothetical protein
MGTLIVLAVVVLGVFLGIVLISLLTVAKKADQIYDRMHRDEEIAARANPYYRLATETLLPTCSGEAQPQRDLTASVVAP